MCEAIRRPVLKLVRISIGRYSLGKLPVGEFVELGHADLRKLLRARRFSRPRPIMNAWVARIRISRRKTPKLPQPEIQNHISSDECHRGGRSRKDSLWG